jgi:O-antigen/teichoic acid export membrane protein
LPGPLAHLIVLSDARHISQTRSPLAARLDAVRLRPALVAMVGLTLAASAVNYGSSLVFSRVLTTESFGDLTALLSLAVVLAVPTGAAQTVVAARVAQYSKAGDEGRIAYIVRYAIAHVGLIGVIAMVLYIAAIPLVNSALDLQASGAAIALTPVIGLAFPVPIILGVLQGLDRYVAFGVMSLAIALSRLAVGVPWAAFAQGGAGGALAGQALGNVLVLLGGVWILRHWLRRRGTGAAMAGLKRRPDAATVSASGAFVAFAVISNFDIVLAKLFLSPRDAGHYAALATIAKILIFLPGAIAVALVPSAARARGSVRGQRSALRIAALAVLGTTLTIAVPIALLPHLTLRLMFGAGYATVSSGVLPMLIAGTGLALLYLLVVYSVTIEDRRWMLLMVAGVALQVAGISLFHDSPTQVATVQAVVVAVVLLLNEAKFHSLLRAPRAPRMDAT